jgi:hypothetical protein
MNSDRVPDAPQQTDPQGADMVADDGELAGLCAVFTDAEQDCFKQWCALIDGHKRPDWDAVVASQEGLHEAALRLRTWCLASPAAAAFAEARRQALMVAQVQGELATKAQLRGRHSAEFGQTVQQGWNSARWAIICERDALTCGLGWPHRAEPVLVTTWYYDEKTNRVDLVDAEGIYSMGHDVYEVSHEVIVPAVGRGATRHYRQICSVYVRWHAAGVPHLREEREPLGPPPPDGDIGLRLRDAPGRRLPAPLQRWPGPADVGIAVPAPPPPPEPLFGLAEVGTARQYVSRGPGEGQAQPRRQPVPPSQASEEATLF